MSHYGKIISSLAPDSTDSYITRPTIANERLKCNSAGEVVLQLKSPYQDGTTHIVMTPLGELKPKIQ
jgi:hypothetical protein